MTRPTSRTRLFEDQTLVYEGADDDEASDDLKIDIGDATDALNRYEHLYERELDREFETKVVLEQKHQKAGSLEGSCTSIRGEQGGSGA